LNGLKKHLLKDGTPPGYDHDSCTFQGFKHDFDPKIGLDKNLIKGENISALTWASAGGIAKLAAIMAGKGSLNGQQLISKDTWEDVHSDIRDEAEAGLGVLTSYGKGGINKFKPSEQYEEQKESPHYIQGMADGFAVGNRIKDGSYGWFGYGGSVLGYHPELNIGFAYTPTDLI
jgi:CubicO group peptidase (beta-lactamase class C family)